MLNKDNYPKAYKETYEVLKLLPKDEYKKIDKDFLNIIEAKMDREYNFKIDSIEKIGSYDFLYETRIVFGYVYLNYFASDEEKKEIEENLNIDVKVAEKEKSKKYPKDVFNSTNKKNKEEVNENKTNNDIAIKKENIFIRLFKRLFSK